MKFRAARRWWLALAGLVLTLAVGVYTLVAASLPRRTGSATLPGLTAPVDVTLDAHAIPTVRAASFADALRAQGYLHAQERFFQMDLVRRAAAGELAALVGERALPADRAQRAFGLRAVAERVGRELPPEQVGWLTAYTAGVNAGLADLRARPPEYWLLGARPETWRVEDSLLVVLSLYTELSDNEIYERGQDVLHATLPPELYRFLTPSSSRFDRPLLGASASDPTGGYTPLPIPGAAVVDLRGTATLPRAPRPRVDPPMIGPASNQWAVDRTRGAQGRAHVANDPHLGLMLPNVFYRAELEWPGGAVRGVSIPGLPGVLIGASTHVAFGATVSNADQSDWVVIKVDPNDPDRYRTPDGFEPFRDVVSEITVAGAPTERLTTRHTRWGPVVAEDWQRRPLALHATWFEPAGINLDILELAAAEDVPSAAAILARWAGPSLNWVLADDLGDIGWVVNGPLPARIGFDGSKPESLADGALAWQGLQTPPQTLGSATGALFTANSRTLPPSEAARVSRMWMRPLRAERIANLLAAEPQLDERASLAMQLDTRAAGYEALRALVLEVVPGDEREPLLERARNHAVAWNGHADVDQPAFRLLHAYYRTLLERTLEPLVAPAIAADSTFVYGWPLADEVLRRLLEERPVHFLTREHASWPAFLRHTLLDTLHELERTGGGIEAPWGAVNTLDVAHPFAALGPLAPLKPWLKLETAPLPGSMISLRVAAPDYGAVLRMAVAPGAPENGVLELAGGQSGHFLSPNFRDLHPDWLAGTPTPFLAGPPVTRIVLTP